MSRARNKGIVCDIFGVGYASAGAVDTLLINSVEAGV